MQRWMDCDLCSFVENRFHHRLEPQALAPHERAMWIGRAITRDERLFDPRHSRFHAAFWIVDRGVRVGTVALPTTTLGHQFLPIYSLYVFPAQRSGGFAYRMLRSIYQASDGYLGIRASAYWTWQAAVRRYLFRYGMWAWSFKRSIDFVWTDDLPPHIVTVAGDGARFAIEQGGRVLELLTASRAGDVLIWNELPPITSGGLDAVVAFHARSTFAVALAAHGWPLLRAGDDVDDVLGCDVGGPDVLAVKIATFEYFDRRSGFDVRTPRIPGLPYDAIARKLED